MIDLRFDLVSIGITSGSGRSVPSSSTVVVRQLVRQPMGLSECGVLVIAARFRLFGLACNWRAAVYEVSSTGEAWDSEPWSIVELESDVTRQGDYRTKSVSVCGHWRHQRCQVL